MHNSFILQRHYATGPYKEPDESTPHHHTTLL